MEVYAEAEAEAAAVKAAKNLPLSDTLAAFYAFSVSCIRNDYPFKK